MVRLRRSAGMTAIIAHGVKEPWHAITLGQQHYHRHERLPIRILQLRPSVVLALRYYGDLTAEFMVALPRRLYRAPKR